MKFLTKIAADSPEVAQQLIQVLDQGVDKALEGLQDDLLPEDQAATFSVPVEHVLQFLEEALALEYESLVTYYAMAGLVRGIWRDIIADEFKEHGEEELEHVEQFTLWYAALAGGQMPKIDVPVPAIPYTSISDMIGVLIQQEEKSIKHYSKGLDFAGEVVGFKVELEEIISKEQEHVNELKALLPVPTDNT